MDARAIGWLVTLALVAGCTSASGTPEPTAAPSAGGPSEPSVVLIGDAPVIATDAAAVLDGFSFLLPAAMVYSEEPYRPAGFHAYVVAFTEAQGERRGFHLTSTDGLGWQADEADPLATLGLELGQLGPIPTSVLPDPDGGWLMYLWGESAGTSGSAVWRATAPTEAGPWLADPEPVLIGDADGWDSAGIEFPSVIHGPDGYLMAYAGAGTDYRNTGRIGLATSDDGLTWTRGDEPIMQPGHCGGFDARSIGQPRLIATDAGYLIAYSGDPLAAGDSAIGLSFSSDGQTWACASDGSILQRGDVPGSLGIQTIALSVGPRGPMLLIESLAEDSSALWLAELLDTP